MQFQSSESSNLSVDEVFSINVVMSLGLLLKIRDQLPKRIACVRTESLLSNNFVSMVVLFKRVLILM